MECDQSFRRIVNPKTLFNRDIAKYTSGFRRRLFVVSHVAGE